MEFYTLASGSSGNASLLRTEGCCILIDAGISCRRICKALQTLSLTVADVDAILLTHSHRDHIAGLPVLCKRCHAPIYATAETFSLLQLPALHPITAQQSFTVGDVEILPLATAHDVAGSVGFRFDSPDGSMGYLTDTGHVPAEALRSLLGVELAVLEANHDVNVLLCGAYPYSLKRRILSDHGHLSNESAGHCAVTLAKHGTGQIVLAHLSRENNTPELAWQTVQSVLQEANCSVQLSVAPRDIQSEVYLICKKSPSCASGS